MLFKKVDATVMDILSMYVSTAVLIVAASSLSYTIGKECGKREIVARMNEQYETLENEES